MSYLNILDQQSEGHENMTPLCRSFQAGFSQSEPEAGFSTKSMSDFFGILFQELFVLQLIGRLFVWLPIAAGFFPTMTSARPQQSNPPTNECSSTSKRWAGIRRRTRRVRMPAPDVRTWSDAVAPGEHTVRNGPPRGFRAKRCRGCCKKRRSNHRETEVQRFLALVFSFFCEKIRLYG